MKAEVKGSAKAVREYLAFIGKRGGQTSRRELTKAQARRMVVIREAKRAAVKAGQVTKALPRWPLNLAPERVVRRSFSSSGGRHMFAPQFHRLGA